MERGLWQFALEPRSFGSSRGSLFWRPFSWDSPGSNTMPIGCRRSACPGSWWESGRPRECVVLRRGCTSTDIWRERPCNLFCSREPLLPRWRFSGAISRGTGSLWVCEMRSTCGVMFSRAGHGSMRFPGAGNLREPSSGLVEASVAFTPGRSWGTRLWNSSLGRSGKGRSFQEWPGRRLQWPRWMSVGEGRGNRCSSR